MKKTTVFIIEKDGQVANLIRYQLLLRTARHVQVFPSPAECLYYMHKKSVPDFLVADLGSTEVRASTFLKEVLQAFPGVKILFLSSYSDQVLADELIQQGATDYIYKSERPEVWIHELIKNMEFLFRENICLN